MVGILGRLFTYFLCVPPTFSFFLSLPLFFFLSVFCVCVCQFSALLSFYIYDIFLLADHGVYGLVFPEVICAVILARTDCRLV